MEKEGLDTIQSWQRWSVPVVSGNGTPQEVHSGERIKFMDERHSGQNGCSLWMFRIAPHVGHSGGKRRSARPETIFLASHIIIENCQLQNRLFNGHYGRTRPQRLNIVKFPDRFMKDVYYHVTIVHQNPAS